jgi:hypothetical protein
VASHEATFTGDVGQISHGEEGRGDAGSTSATPLVAR